jgi:SpoVK/Ycf46/Vps4 family AAA+-type ATPase
LGLLKANDAPSFRDAADHEFILDSAASPHLVALRRIGQCQERLQICLPRHQNINVHMHPMRTTLTLDDDVAVQLERLRRSREANLKDLVNEALRLGLREMIGKAKEAKAVPNTDIRYGPAAY